jgi:hypothetical protein
MRFPTAFLMINLADALPSVRSGHVAVAEARLLGARERPDQPSGLSEPRPIANRRLQRAARMPLAAGRRNARERRRCAEAPKTSLRRRTSCARGARFRGRIPAASLAPAAQARTAARNLPRRVVRLSAERELHPPVCRIRTDASG